MPAPDVLLARAIAGLHLALIGYVAALPFLPVPIEHRVVYLWVVGSILVHWLTSNTTCALTLLENRLRGKTEDESFIYSVVGPVYDLKKSVSDAAVRQVVRFATIALWCWNLSRLVAACGGVRPALQAAFLVKKFKRIL